MAIQQGGIHLPIPSRRLSLFLPLFFGFIFSVVLFFCVFAHHNKMWVYEKQKGERTKITSSKFERVEGDEDVERGCGCRRVEPAWGTVEGGGGE